MAHPRLSNYANVYMCNPKTTTRMNMRSFPWHTQDFPATCLMCNPNATTLLLSCYPNNLFPGKYPCVDEVSVRPLVIYILYSIKYFVVNAKAPPS